MASSIFALITMCLGAGTLSIPYVFYANGILFGTMLLIFGACLSLYTGWLNVTCCSRLRARRYEEIAEATYGGKASFITSLCLLACLMGFIVSYIVLVRDHYDNLELVQRASPIYVREALRPPIASYCKSGLRRESFLVLYILRKFLIQ